MTHRNAFSVIALTLAFGLLSPQRAMAQEAQSFEQKYFKPELFVSVGHAVAGNWWSECCPPHWSNLGIGLTLRLSRRIGVEVEGNHMLGAEPVKVSGTGIRPSDRARFPYEYHSGVSSLTLGSGNVLYYFSDKRVQPYLSGGIGAIWERGMVGERDFENGGTIGLRYQDNEMAGTLGGGVKISITPRISVRPELRLYEPTGSLHSIGRVSVAAAYRW